MRKLVYFVRHGESITNASDTHYGPDAPLTEKGREQARFVASRFAHEHIDAVYVSNMPRSHETGQAIAEATGAPLCTLAELHETRKPSFFVGKKKHAPLVLEAKAAMKAIVHSAEGRVHDEETFADVSARVVHVLSALAAAQEERIVAVSHGDFMRHVFGHIVLGEAFLPEHRALLRERMPTTNTGVTLAECRDGAWRIHTWNDRAHLAETKEPEPSGDFL